MTTENWRTTPQESVLDAIYEGLVAHSDEFIPNIFGVTVDRPLALLYVEDSEGNCWEIAANPHPHPTTGEI